MELTTYRDPVNRNRIFTIIITDDDVFNAYPVILKRHKTELDYFTRPNASIEERLMALQLYARVLEDFHDE